MGARRFHAGIREVIIFALGLNDAHLVKFPDSKHEILMERDEIRDRALGKILEFFKN